MLKVFRDLKSKGIDIWVDVKGSSCLGEMAGSTDEMMAKATAPCPAFVKRRLVIHTRFIAGRESFKPRGRVCLQEIPGVCELRTRGDAQHIVCLSILCECRNFALALNP